MDVSVLAASAAALNNSATSPPENFWFQWAIWADALFSGMGRWNFAPASRENISPRISSKAWPLSVLGLFWRFSREPCPVAE